MNDVMPLRMKLARLAHDHGWSLEGSTSAWDEYRRGGDVVRTNWNGGKLIHATKALDKPYVASVRRLLTAPAGDQS